MGSPESSALCALLRAKPGHLQTSGGFELWKHDTTLPHHIRAQKSDTAALDYYRSQLPVVREDLEPLKRAVLDLKGRPVTDASKDIVSLGQSVASLTTSVASVREDVAALRCEMRSELQALGASLSRDLSAALAAMSTLLATRGPAAVGAPGPDTPHAAPGVAVDPADVVPTLLLKAEELRLAALPAVPRVQHPDVVRAPSPSC